MSHNNSFLGFNAQAVTVSGNIHYIVNARAISDNQEYSASGISTTMEEAEKIALRKLKSYLPECKSDTPGNLSETPVPQQSASKDELNGGGNKPISEKQIWCITELCKRTGIDVEKFILERFTKKVDELVGSEANALIRELKKNEW